MGTVPNISSIFLLIPLLHNYHALSLYENLSIISFALTSFLFHSSREYDIATTDDLSLRTYYLYKLDHLHIQMGLVYILARHYISEYPLLYSCFVTFVIVNDLMNINSSANKLTAILIAINLIRTIIMSPNPFETIILIILCLCIAKGSFKGSDVPSSEADSGFGHMKWSEWDKCKWHLSMGILISMMIGNMICMSQ